MAVYTYTRNVDEHSSTGSITFLRTDGVTKVTIPVGYAMDFSAEEVTRLSQYIVLTPGGTPNVPSQQPVVETVMAVIGPNGWTPIKPLLVSSANTQLAASPDSMIVGAITRDANGAAISAGVIWPDGATGTYTATTVSAAFPGAVDAYTITHVLNALTLTYTQPAVTRDANGVVTNRPAITVA